MKTCVVCDKILAPRKRTFCSLPCKRAWERSLIEKLCSSCGNVYTIQRNGDRRPQHTLCKSCSSRERLRKAGLIGLSGPDSPTWKGGHTSWQSGKLGRDKDGLSWKLQRKLALERDQYTCQHCGAKGGRRNPDVHHIRPYRVSFSHALDNLICLCQSCHKEAEAQLIEVWGGHKLCPPIKTRRLACALCGSKRRKLYNGICHACFLNCAVDRARDLLVQGLSHSEVARQVGVNRTALYRHLNHFQ